MEEEKVNNMKRDYDKNPIVIEDRMPEISFLIISIFFLGAIIFVLLFIPFKENLDFKYIILYGLLMYGTTFYFLKSRIKKHKKIIFQNNSIVREWNDDKLEIKCSDIKNIQKSFIDFYNKKQEALDLYRPIYYLLLPLSILLQHPVLIVVKYFYKVVKGFSNRSLFDTIVIFDKNEEMIAVFLATLEEREALKEYFLKKGFDIDNLSMFYTNQYSPDELTYYFNKKDK